MKKLLYIFLLPVLALAISLEIDSTGQRTDGSQLWDIWFTIGEVAMSDSVNIFVDATTESGEKLNCVTLSGDYPVVYGPSSYHIVWNFGGDVPNREFYYNGISVGVAATKENIVPGDCFVDSCPLAAGDGHTVALKSDGSVWAWGANFYGQLGDGTTTDRHSPIQVHGANDTGYLTDIVAIATGYSHTVALKSDGTVWAWGANWAGQLGDGTATDRHTPIQVHGSGDVGYLTDITAIAAGEWHTVALKSDGTVWAWGANWAGQLGDGTATEKHSPVQVHGSGDVGYLTDITAIAAGEWHTVALKSNGSVWAWGRNDEGQLGDGTVTEKHTPVQVHGSGDVGYLTDITAVAAGE